MPALTLADFAMIAVIAFSGLFAFVRGFVRELFGVGSWVGSAVITFFGYGSTTAFSREFIDNRLFADLTGIIGLFLVSLVLFSLLTHLVANRVRGTILDAPDRALGLAFGLLRGIAVVALLLLGIQTMVDEDKRPGWYNTSHLAPLLLDYSQQGLLEAQRRLDVSVPTLTPESQSKENPRKEMPAEPNAAKEPEVLLPEVLTPVAKELLPALLPEGLPNGAPSTKTPEKTPVKIPAKTSKSTSPAYETDDRKRLDELFEKKP
jgi:membrane protein required for colicin V production